MKLALLLTFFISYAHAFTLNNNFGASFSSKNVKVSIATNSTCANAGVTVYELLDLIGPAINNFWNEVPSSGLRLKKNGVTASPIANINGGRLCAPTDDACLTDATTHAQALIAPVDGIIISCNGLVDNFGSSNVLAVTVPNHFSGKKIKGAVILINDSSTIFSTLSKSDRIGVIAHEIGHAIGLGHSTDTASLMYYKTVSLRSNLGQDDVDGVSFLYPVKIDGCGLFSGTISTDGSGGNDTPSHLLQMGLGFLIILLLSKLRKLFHRPKACPAF